MLLRITIALALFAGIAYADHKDDVRTDFDNLCNARERSGADKEKNPSERAEKMAEYLKKTLKTEEVKKLFASLADMNPADAGPKVKAEAAKAGYTGACPIVDKK
jgi:hypothetical protein